MSTRSDVLLWAKRVVARGNAQPHEILELPITAGMDEAQDAFHKIARVAHPDLHRTTMTAEELELVTTAYSRAASAYQDFRGQRAQTTRIRPIKDSVGGVPARPYATPQSGSAPIPKPATDAPSGGSTTANAANAMSSKALIYYRKAELSLKRGDLRGAVLQLKMAIAADPKSQFLRTALTEVEAEVGKKP